MAVMLLWFCLWVRGRGRGKAAHHCSSERENFNAWPALGNNKRAYLTISTILGKQVRARRAGVDGSNEFHSWQGCDTALALLLKCTRGRGRARAGDQSHQPPCMTACIQALHASEATYSSWNRCHARIGCCWSTACSCSSKARVMIRCMWCLF